MEKHSQYELTKYEMDMIRIKANQLSRTSGFTAHDVEDIQQELALELIRRLPMFNPAKARRTTFASMVVRNRIRNLVRDRNAEMRDPRLNGPSLNEITHTKEGEEIELIEMVSQDEADIVNGNRTTRPDEGVALRVDVGNVLARLPRHLRQAADLLSRMSVTDAADALGMPRTSFRKQRVRHLREAFAHLAPYIGGAGPESVTAG